VPNSYNPSRDAFSGANVLEGSAEDDLVRCVLVVDGGESIGVAGLGALMSVLIALVLDRNDILKGQRLILFSLITVA
jgi:hypothetical protein